MVYFLAILFVIIGILLLVKSNKMTNSQGLKLIVRISSVSNVILGIVLFFYGVIGNNIYLP